MESLIGLLRWVSRFRAGSQTQLVKHLVPDQHGALFLCSPGRGTAETIRMAMAHEFQIPTTSK